MSTRFVPQRRLSLLVAAAITVIASSATAQTAKDEYLDFEGGPLWLPGSTDGLSGGVASFAPGGFGSFAPSYSSATATLGLSFKGVSQFDLRNVLGGSYIPPDTMGAVGTTQFMETTNGVYAVYDKLTGARLAMQSAATFWTAAGATGGLNGDARLMFDKGSQKWIALQFGASVSDIQIAVSTTSNALGPWQSTKFTGFAGGVFGGVADYPTLAIDGQAIYIGTNNFTCNNPSCSSAGFSGTTLNVIARSDLLGAGAPTTTSLKQFTTPYVSSSSSNQDGGFAIQGVNNGTGSGQVIAASLFSNDSIRYDIANPGTAGATKGATTFLGLTDYGANNNARQPDGTRNIDPLDQRIGASSWERNGKIYGVYTATPLGADHTEVRFVVTDAATNAVIQQGAISDPNFDFYEGAINVNASGQVVISYNRSGYQTADLNGDGVADGNVSVFARTFNTNGSGQLVQTDDILLYASSVGDYHNGSVEGAAASGRQRWGDYAAVSLDPNNDQNFWVIGEYADSWNNAAGCSASTTPGCNGSGGSTWGTWIAEITLAPISTPVPEPANYALMLAGLAALGAVARRRKAVTA